MSEFVGSGTRYVSKSGNDANAGTDPNLPKLTINNGISGLVENNSLIVGTGLYDPTNLNLAPSNRPISVVGDTQRSVILDGGVASNTLVTAVAVAGGPSQLINLTILNYTFIVNDSAGQNGIRFRMNNCICIGGEIRLDCNNSSWEGGYDNCIFIGCTFRHQGLGSGLPINNSILINCTINNPEGSKVSINSCYIENLLGVGDPINKVRNCCLRGVNNYTAITESSNITDDPLFLGNPQNDYSKVVSQQSPLLGGGRNATNIGNVRAGNNQNELTIEWGTSPASNNNTNFDSASALIVTAGNVGTRESDIIDLEQVRNSPVINISGLVDFLNNVPDFNNALINPNNLTFEAQWAGVDGVFNGVWRSFMFGQRMLLDILNNTTGDTNFDWSNTVEIQARFLRIRITVRNDYNIA